MLTMDQIELTASQVAKEYPIKKISLFGSYADGSNSEDSDIDFLVEFFSSPVSLLTLSGLKYRLEELLEKQVDVIHAPIPKDSLITIENEVLLYES